LHLPDHVPAEEGDLLNFGIKPDRFHLFDEKTEQSFPKRRADGSRTASAA
jgi:multiple sugar transport system ATP-binding protein